MRRAPPMSSIIDKKKNLNSSSITSLVILPTAAGLGV